MKVTMPEPFMYGIMGPDGEPYFGELCVSGDKDDLAADISDLNDGNDAGPYQEVALVTATQMEAYAAAKAREALGWISVDDRLPPDDGTEVIAVYGGNELEIVWGQIIHETHADRAYSHWMPLPPPPTQ